MLTSLRRRFAFLILPLVVTSVGSIAGTIYVARSFAEHLAGLRADMAMQLEGQKLRDALDREIRFARRLARREGGAGLHDLQERRDPVRGILHTMLRLCSPQQTGEAGGRDAGSRALIQLDAAFSRLFNLEDEAIRLGRAGQDAAAAVMFDTQIEPLLSRTLVPAIAERSEAEQLKVEADWEGIDGDFRRVSLGLLLVGVLVALVAIATPLLLAREFVAPVLRIREAAKRWGSGDFTARVTARASDEMAVVASSLNEMAGSLGRTLVSKEYVDNILDSMMDALFVLSPAGLVTKANGAALMLLGYTEDELLGRPFGSLVPEADPARGAAVFELLRSTSVRDLERTLLTRDGRAISVLLTGSIMFDGARQVRGIVCVAHDIAALKRAQEELRRSESQLRHAQKMEMVGRLAGGVAHDFNNLLQAVLTTVERLRLKHQEPETVALTVSEIESELKRGAALTRQLLLFARRDVEKPELLDLNEVAQNGATFLRHVIGANISVALDLAPGRLPVKADRGHLEQVLMNLVVNGSEAMVDGGNLTVRTYSTEGEEVVLEVRDTGPGIPEPLRARIFEPFFSTKIGEHGAGLGLAVVSGIVTALGGRIELESTESRGATFRVVLPRQPELETDQLSPAIALADVAQGRGERILVVEDETAARESLEEMLTLLGYNVTAVGSGEDAGLLPVEPVFDLLLTDLMLPGIAGGDLARGLLERWPRLKVIAMSGYTDDAVARTSVKGGKLRFLQKPFNLQALAAELRAALDEPVSERRTLR